MKLFTIGYGGRRPDELIHRLTLAGVRTVVDVRLRPDRASMGVYVKAKTPDRGIERLFTTADIGYRSLPELGNVFLEYEDWRQRYAALLQCAGHLLVSRLDGLESPVCLICAERRATECHRLLIAEFLAEQGHEIEHLE